MTHPLEQRLVRLRRRVRRWLIVHGLGRLVAAAVGSVVALGLVDYLVRFDDRGIRLMLTGAIAATVAWACYRWAYRPVTARLGLLDLARRVGRRFPELGDDLPSAVEFLHQAEDDPVAGSAGLRRAVIAQTESRAEKVDFTSMLDRRPVVRGSLLAAGVCLVAAILVVVDTLSCQIAVARLAYPLGEVAWPRKNHLELVHRIDRVARGQSFEVEVIDRDGARLPARAEIHYRLDGPDGGTVEEVQPMRQVGSTLVARRENVASPFAYRIEGGDDRSMRWIDVEVVEPPAVASVAATIIPPTYTGRPATQSTGQLGLLRGSRVEIDAVATKPLQSAMLALDDGQTFACQIGKDGRRFTVASGAARGFVPEQSGYYWFELVDREGIDGGGPRWDIQVLDDQPPAVSVERPPGTTFVTPEATLPLRVTATDDLALRRIELVVDEGGEKGSGVFVRQQPSRGKGPPANKDSRPLFSITLFEGPPRAVPAVDGAQGQRRTVDYAWNLAELRLRPGDQFTFHASAEDYFPQRGKSDSRSVVVVRSEELIDRLAAQQESILAELARALNLQQESRRQLGRLDRAGGLDRVGVDRLRGAELGQREVNRILGSREDGVPAQIERLLDELRNNRLDSPDVQRRMESLLDELGRLAAGVLPTVARELTAALKAAEARLETSPGEPRDEKANRSGTPLAASLTAARAGQDEVIAVLERLLGRLNRWNDYRRFHQRWAQLLRRQQALAERTESLGRDLLGARPEDVQPETAARLKTVAGDQIELARQLDQLVQEMDESRVALATRDPLAAETVLAAVLRARELGTSARMRTAGDAVERNRLGQATALQTRIIAELREVLELLANRRVDELARLVETLPETEGQLSALVRRQKSLGERMEQEAQSVADEALRRAEWESLGRQQAQLQADTARLADRLAQLLADEPAESLREAAGQMGQAGRAAGQADAHAATSHATRAERSLDEAVERLARHVARIQADAAAQELARLEAAVALIHQRQTKTAELTKGLDEARAPMDNRPGVLRRLAADQAMLEKETSDLAASLEQARVLERVLGDAAGQMAVAAGWLGRQASDARVQTPQQAATDRLAWLLESLRAAPSDAQAAPPGGAQGAAAGKPPGKPAAPGAVAQLRLLKTLQQDLFERTQQWQERFGGQSPLPAEAQREYKQLSDEQGRLADLLFDLIGGGR